MEKGKIERFVIFIFFLLITLILYILAKTPPASGYEISIYQAYPWYFWLIMIIGYIFGIFLIFYEVLIKHKHNKVTIGVSFSLLFLLTLIILYLPFIRGYATYGRGDVLTHIGFIKDIIHLNQIPDYNWYPMVHILGAFFWDIGGMGPTRTVMILPPIFFMLHISGLFLLGRELFNIKIGIIACGLGFVLLKPTSYIGLHYIPHSLAFFLLPLMLYLVLKLSRPGKEILTIMTIAIIMSTSHNIFHPLRSLFFIFILVSIIIFQNKVYTTIDSKFPKNYGRKDISLIVIFSSIIFYMWYFSFSRILDPFKTLMLGIGGVQKVEGYRSILARASPQFSDLFMLIIFRYGVIAILFLCTIAFLLIYIKDIDNKLRDFDFSFIFVVFSFLVFLSISIVMFLIPSPANYERFLDYAAMFSILLIVFFFNIYIRDGKKINKVKKYFNIILLAIIIFLIITISILSVYPSRLTRSTNHQVTEMELNGMEWTFENRNENISIVERSGSMRDRFHDCLYGRSFLDQNLRGGEDAIVPDHFGYNESNILGNQYDEEKYLIISELDRITYEKIHPDYEEYWRFTLEDYEKLEKDHSVVRIYDNGEYNTYIINENVSQN
ncbi:MAG: hypothetical protein ACOCT9_00490 [archaeon]